MEKIHGMEALDKIVQFAFICSIPFHSIPQTNKSVLFSSPLLPLIKISFCLFMSILNWEKLILRFFPVQSMSV